MIWHDPRSVAEIPKIIRNLPKVVSSCNQNPTSCERHWCKSCFHLMSVASATCQKCHTWSHFIELGLGWVQADKAGGAAKLTCTSALRGPKKRLWGDVQNTALYYSPILLCFFIVYLFKSVPVGSCSCVLTHCQLHCQKHSSTYSNVSTALQLFPENDLGSKIFIRRVIKQKEEKMTQQQFAMICL